MLSLGRQASKEGVAEPLAVWEKLSGTNATQTLEECTNVTSVLEALAQHQKDSEPHPILQCRMASMSEQVSQPRRFGRDKVVEVTTWTTTLVASSGNGTPSWGKCQTRLNAAYALGIK